MSGLKTPSYWFWILGATVFCALLSPEALLLDEETHLYIAGHTSLSHPYDWKMPFAPFHDTGFVFAHPPLFQWWVKLIGDGVWTGFPWLILWWSGVWRLALHYKVSPQLCIALLLCSAGVLLPLTRTMMPDLMVSALGLTAMSLYLSSPESDVIRLFGAGLLLGLAMWTKYPAVMLLILPLLLERSTSKLMWFALPALFVLLLGEGWLYIQYEQWHLWTVLQEASVVGRSPMGHRFFGVPIRMGLAMFPIALVGVVRFPFFPLGVIGVGAYLLDAKLGLYLGLGLSALSLLWKGERWLVVWVVLVLFGVTVGHNYASPRYWLVATVPLAIFAAQQMQNWVVWHRRVAVGLSALWCSVVILTEREHAVQSVALGRTALAELPGSVSLEDLSFSGEWTFRAEMMRANVPSFDGNQPYVLTAVNSAGWTPHESDGWHLVKSWDGPETHVLLSSASSSVGWYSDTLGVYPMDIALASKPIERVELWKKP